MKRSLPLDRIPSPPRIRAGGPAHPGRHSLWQLLSQSVNLKLWSYGPYQTVMHFFTVLDRHITGHFFSSGRGEPKLPATSHGLGDGKQETRPRQLSVLGKFSYCVPHTPLLTHTKLKKSTDRHDQDTDRGMQFSNAVTAILHATQPVPLSYCGSQAIAPRRRF